MPASSASPSLPSAVEQARTAVGDFGLEGRAEFRVGDLTGTGLPDRSVDAATCIDSVRFADPTIAATEECRRVPAAQRVLPTLPNVRRLFGRAVAPGRG